MDTDTLVAGNALIEGGARGLDLVATRLSESGIILDGVYLLGMARDDGSRSWFLRIVSSQDQREVLVKAIELKHDGRLPQIADRVAISPIRPGHPEASRVLGFARRYDLPEIVIDGQMLDGLYVDYALVGSSIPAAA
jgi:hypothetical protein